MSIFSDPTGPEQEINHPCRGIERILEARFADLGDFMVRRLLPSSHQQMIGPWIFFDHFGPHAFEAHKGIDIRPHPHINMATVTYLFEGHLLHQDSTAIVQTIEPGALNLMFAGAGIVHSERTPEKIRDHAHRIHGLQLWLAVPEAIEEDPPQFYHYEAKALPYFEVGAIKGRVMIGEAYGVYSPVKVFSPTLYFEARIPGGQSLDLPKAPKEIGIYLIEGSLTSQQIQITPNSMAISTSHDGITIQALEDTHIVVIGGEPLGKRAIWWNFVSSNPQRITQAADDWQNNRFPQIADDNKEYIPLPEKH